MIFSIRSKLFSTLLAATSGVVLCMYLVMQWSFDQGFLNYVNQQAEQRHLAFSEQLSQEWLKSGSWQIIADNRQYWFELMWSVWAPDVGAIGDHQRPERPPFKLPENVKSKGGEAQRLLPPEHHLVGKLPHLLDANKTLLHGRPGPLADLKLYPIVANGVTVGYLGQVKHRVKLDRLALKFVQQQTTTFIFVAVIMVLISLIAALPVTAHLAKPIKKLTQGTLRLIAGKYHTTIPVISDDELGLLSRNFNALAYTLKENEQARRQWGADISHELRTPLAILKGEIEAIQDGIRIATPEAIDSLHGEVEHLNNLVNDLYELSMSDIGALNYHKEVLDPCLHLEAIIALYRSEFERQGITLTFDNDASKSLILADGTRLKQLFTNILKNTLAYTDSPGKLVIEMRSDGQELTLHFKDSSPGVSSEAQGKIFERLYRVESSRSRMTGGAGLGLSICHNIVKAHGGSIEAKTSSMGGLWLIVKLPLWMN